MFLKVTKSMAGPGLACHSSGFTTWNEAFIERYDE
jgi:hypothetical protein